MSHREELEKINQMKVTIFNIPIGWFLVIVLLTVFAMYTGNLPAGMVGTLLILMVLGEFLGWIGDRTPLLRSYLGGGAIVAVFGSAFLVHMNWIPEVTTVAIADFMQGTGFLNFYIAGLITGSILSIDAQILMKAGVRFAIPLLAGVTVAVIIGGVFGMIIGDGFIQNILFVVLPLLGGGMGLGGVPMSQLYADVLGNDPSYYISILVPAIALGNLLAIVLASVLNGLGNKFPSLTGNGVMIPGFTYEKAQVKDYSVGQLGIGLIAGLLFFTVSTMLSEWIPLHPFALMILVIAIFKVTGILPSFLVDAAIAWYQSVLKNWTYALLVGIGVTFTDFSVIIEAFTSQFVLIVGVIVLAVALTAGIVGRFVGLYPIEASITAGLGMISMGGTGDVSVLAAARRMELMAFCQIASTLGASLILFLADLFSRML